MQLIVIMMIFCISKLETVSWRILMSEVIRCPVCGKEKNIYHLQILTVSTVDLIMLLSNYLLARNHIRFGEKA